MKALVVDDTALYRKILSEALRGLPGIEKVQATASGELALKILANEPFAFVLLDVHMPGMDGLETLDKIRENHPGVDVIMISGVSDHGATSTVNALNLGALEFIRKPEGNNAEESMTVLKNRLRPLMRLVETRQITHRVTQGGNKMPASRKTAPPVATPKAPSLPKAVSKVAPPPKKFEVMVIGISTGGPRSLVEVIPALPADFPIPILIVQHMPPKFTEALALDLDRRSPLTVVEGREGQVVETGKVYIAPGGKHMVARKNNTHIEIAVNTEPPENSCRPAADVLFRSVADAYGGKGVLAAVMTGMGSDGTKGLALLKQKGCYCVTQSEKTCVVYGMPMCVEQAGLSDESADLNDLAKRFTELAWKGRR